MPPALRHEFLGWMQSASTSCSLVELQQVDEDRTPSDLVDLAESSKVSRNDVLKGEGQDKRDRSHVRLSQLFDEGLTRAGMSVRVRLTQDRAKEVGRDYLNSLTISATGTIFHEGQVFDKVSPLAGKLNGCTLNGWEYLEVKKDGEWIKFDTLRRQLRQENGN
ncbi:hypothetical protein [Chamaesiphon sp.]|uniref:hypothetical protein n=1 Tax=Chamaesiphon sp. TaxID=2814140 RepID=UPI0035937F6D